MSESIGGFYIVCDIALVKFSPVRQDVMLATHFETAILCCFTRWNLGGEEVRV